MRSFRQRIRRGLQKNCFLAAHRALRRLHRRLCSLRPGGRLGVLLGSVALAAPVVLSACVCGHLPSGASLLARPGRAPAVLTFCEEGLFWTWRLPALPRLPGLLPLMQVLLLLLLPLPLPLQQPLLPLVLQLQLLWIHRILARRSPGRVLASYPRPCLRRSALLRSWTLLLSLCVHFRRVLHNHCRCPHRPQWVHVAPQSVAVYRATHLWLCLRRHLVCCYQLALAMWLQSLR